MLVLLALTAFAQDPTVEELLAATDDVTRGASSRARAVRSAMVDAEGVLYLDFDEASQR